MANECANHTSYIQSMNMFITTRSPIQHKTFTLKTIIHRKSGTHGGCRWLTFYLQEPSHHERRHCQWQESCCRTSSVHILANNIKIDATLVRTDRCQGSMNAAIDPLENQRIHLEASIIKAKHQLGVPLANAKHDIIEGLPESG